MRFVLALLAVLTLSPRVEAWGFAAHRVVNRSAVSTLPEPLGALFRGNVDYLAEHAIDPDLWRTAGMPAEDPNHFLDMDALGDGPIPRVEAELLARLGPAAAGRGRLPWRVAEVYEDLVEAFRARDMPRVLERAAVLGHYVGDAHVPFHATVNHDGQATGQNGIHSRWETGLFEHFQGELVAALQPAPARAITDAVGLTFEVLGESYAAVAPALESDRTSAGAADLPDTPEDDRYDDAYYARLYASEGPRLRARLQDAASRVGSLWLSAWIDAGRPEVDPQFRFAYVRRATRAILVSLDGGAQSVFDDGIARGVMPEMARLRAEGATARGSLTSLPAKTPAGHAALFTGAWSDRNGIGGIEVPVAGGSIVAAVSGFSSSPLRAEPLWVTAARQGLDVTVVSATQSHPFAPYLEEKRFGGNFGSALTLLDGFQTLRIPAAVYGPRDLPLKAPSGWREPLPPHAGEAREFALAVEGARVDGLVYDDPADPVKGFDTMALSVGKRATGATILKPRALGTSADAFGRVTVTVAEGTLGLHFRLFALSPDGAEILLFRSEAGVLKSSRPSVAAGALAETGGFTPNGGDDVYKAGGFGAPLWKGGDGTAERRYLETVELVERQFDRLLDFGADRTRWELLIGYLPYPDEALHLWLGYLDSSLPGYDAALAARLRPHMDRVLGIVDRFVAKGRARAERAGAAFAVGADHGMMAVNRQVRFNVALQRAGLLAIGSGGAIDLARTRAVYFPGNSGYFLVNRLSRPGGIVDERGEEVVLSQLRGVLREIRDPATDQPVVTGVMDPHTWSQEPAIGGPQGGDLYVALAPGYTASANLQGKLVEAAPPRGEHLLSPERATMLASFVIAGPGISKGADLGPIRQVDVAPTLSALLGIEAPAQAVGSPLCAALARFGSAPGVESAPSHAIRCASPPRLDFSSPP